MQSAFTSRVLRSGRQLDDRYLLSGFLILLCIGVFAFAGDGRVGRTITVALQGITLLEILHTSRAHRRTIRVVAALCVLAVLAVAWSESFDGKLAHAAPFLVCAALALGAPFVILRRLIQQSEIDFRTVAGALCIYLLAGLLLALVYASMNALQKPFFVQSGAGGSADFVYYSFVTLTTVGYGDLTSRTDLGHITSIFESLFGQLYLVSVVALLVSNLGRPRRKIS
jgi:Ion channel